MEPLSERELEIQKMLQKHVEKMAAEIGERNVMAYHGLTASADFIEDFLSTSGYQVHRQEFRVQGKICQNIEVEITGSDRPNEIVIIGGHYDSVFGSPGANDNATGAAAVLVLAKFFAQKRCSKTLRFLEFVNEEPPYFRTPEMGSLVYAKRCRKRNESIVAMLNLECIGYYSDKEESQHYPFPLNLLYPSTGNFIGFVGNLGSRRLVRQVSDLFRSQTRFPSIGAALPSIIPGIGWSDQWAFWQQGYPAIMVTDTALFRYPYYHTEYDTAEKIQYDRLAQVVAGLEGVIVGML